MDIKFLTQENEIQKLYSKFGLVVPVGDLENGKAPAIQPLPSTSTQTSVTAQFNIMSGTDITAMSYTVDGGESVSITPTKGIVTITITDLEYNSGPYEIELTAENGIGGTSAKATAALQPYTDWAEPESVLAGNRFIVNGEEEVGTIPTKTADDVTVTPYTVTLPAGYYGESVELTVAEKPEFLCFTAQDDCQIAVILTSTYTQPVLYVSRDTDNWTLWDHQAGAQVLQAGEKLYIYGDNPGGVNTNVDNYWNFQIIGGRASVSGNIQTLLSRNVSNSLPTAAFCKLFSYNTLLTSITGLKLPSTIVPNSAYCRMFEGCTGLTTVPSDLLPATTVGMYAYDSMFSGCSSLRNMPILSATDVSTSAYANMFEGCTSLEEVPAGTIVPNNAGGGMFKNCSSLASVPAGMLPDTHVNSNSYKEMFYGCSSLRSIPSGFLPATELGTNCYQNMFYGCTSLSSVPEDLLPATTLKSNCYNGMFYGCISLVEAPHLPGTNMSTTTNCYKEMFYNCTSLNKIVTYASAWTAQRATNWVSGVAAVGSFYNIGGATIPTGTNGIPSGWTEHSSLYPVWVTGGSLSENNYGYDWVLRLDMLMDGAPASWSGEAVLTIDGEAQPAIQFDGSYSSAPNSYEINGIELTYPFSSASLSVTVYDTTTGNVFGTSTSALVISPVEPSTELFFDNNKIDVYFTPGPPRLVGDTNYIMAFTEEYDETTGQILHNNLVSNVALYDNSLKFTLQKTGVMEDGATAYAVVSSVNPLVAYPNVEHTLEAYQAAGWSPEFMGYTTTSEIVFEISGATINYDSSSDKYVMTPTFSKMPQDSASWIISLQTEYNDGTDYYYGTFDPANWPSDTTFESTEEIVPCGQITEVIVQGSGSWSDETTGEYRSCNIPPIMVTISAPKPCE